MFKSAVSPLIIIILYSLKHYMSRNYHEFIKNLKTGLLSCNSFNYRITCYHVIVIIIEIIFSITYTLKNYCYT